MNDLLPSLLLAGLAIAGRWSLVLPVIGFDSSYAIELFCRGMVLPNPGWLISLFRVPPLFVVLHNS